MGSCALSLLEICSTGVPKLEKRCAKLRQLVEEKCLGELPVLGNYIFGEFLVL